MFKKFFLLIHSVFFAITISAQNHNDALRYSMLSFGGTARYVSTGGAFGALGADFSTLSTNPAGIGLFKGSEFTFTPSIYTGKTSSSYYGMSNEDLKYNFNLNNVGMIFTFKGNGDFKNIQMGFGVNRMANFNNRMAITGDNPKNSIMDDYILKANGNKPSNLDPFDTFLAWETFLLDTLTGGTKYTSVVPQGGIRQSKEVTSWGSMNEMVMTFGGNFNDKLYLGGTIGFPYIRYFEESVYSESDIADTIYDFKKFDINENIETNGSGFNFKFGMIYRINDWVRFGGAIHTPTFFTMQDFYNKSIKSVFDNGDNYTDKSPEGEYNYELTTPMRALGSLAFILGKYGLISADYEFVDYGDARLREENRKTSGNIFAEENNLIKSSYTAQNNLRLGAELNVEQFKFRAGYALYGNPFKAGVNIGGERTYYTFGIGVREKSYFIDLAYVLGKYSEEYFLYPSVPQSVMNDFTSNSFLVTLGFRY